MAPSVEDALSAIKSAIPPDFRSASGQAWVAHRHVENLDYYLVYGAAKGSVCSFRARGNVEFWDPWTGARRSLFATKEVSEGTSVRMPAGEHEPQLIVFTPGVVRSRVIETDLADVFDVRVTETNIEVEGLSAKPGALCASVLVDGQEITATGGVPAIPAPLPLDGEWEFTVQPTLDNQWGDFHLPAFDGLIGAEQRRFRYRLERGDVSEWTQSDFDDSDWESQTYSYGPQFWRVGPISPSEQFEDELAAMQSIVEDWQRVDFSWRYGIEGDPGRQGYHGLKGLVSNEFLGFGRLEMGWPSSRYVFEGAGSYYFWNSLAVDEEQRVVLKTGSLTPAALWLNGRRVSPADELTLAIGSNMVLLRFDGSGRTYAVFERAEPIEEPDGNYPLSMHWYGRKSVVPFDALPASADPVGWYRFVSPPGLRSFQITCHGNLSAWVNGQPASVQAIGKHGTGAMDYAVTVTNADARPAHVALRIGHRRGFYGGAAIVEPIKYECGPGLLSCGDWSRLDGLSSYSGGAWYRKTVAVPSEALGCAAFLDLGSVVATAEVFVNGQSAGIKASSPWVFDISELLTVGENRIEVYVLNALASHYQTVPTQYRGDSTSGLLGPARIEFLGRATLTATLVPLLS